MFDSLGRKRFQVWWEKAGLLSFRVGWLADGGGHTGVVFRWSPVPHFFPIQSQPNILSVSSLFASVGKIVVCGFALALALCFALYFCPVDFALALYFALLLEFI